MSDVLFHVLYKRLKTEINTLKKSVGDDSDRNYILQQLELLRVKKIRILDLMKNIANEPTLKVLMDQAGELLSDTDSIEANWMFKVGSVPSPEKSPDSSPPKPKKSRAEEFQDYLKKPDIKERDIIAKASALLSESEKDNKTLQDKNLWFHTTLKLRFKIEKMEKLMRPENTEQNDWNAVSRRKKWEEFLANLKEHGYDDFVACIQNIEQDPKKLSKQMNKMYSILNARIHNYLVTNEISEEPFKETSLILLAHCLDAVEII